MTSVIWFRHCRVVLEVDQPSWSPCLLEADWATGSANLWTYTSCVHCNSISQSHPALQRLINLSKLKGTLVPNTQVKFFLSIGHSLRRTAYHGGSFIITSKYNGALSLLAIWLNMWHCSLLYEVEPRFSDFSELRITCPVLYYKSLDASKKWE